MWKPKHESKESVLKEALLRQLSHAVKEVQLYHSQTKETCSIQEGTLSLLTVLEAIFLHSLKRTLLESARESMSNVDYTKPTPSFYLALRNVTHKNMATQIAGLKRITTDVGRSRAWIRLALNDGVMSSYLTAVAEDRRASRCYHPSAFLRDREVLDTASKLIEGLLQVPFSIPLNLSILNMWSSEPLLMSGLWAPALRNSVQVAVDVVGGIEDDETETCSVMTASSSVRSLIMMDETQALQYILDANTVLEQEEAPHEELNIVEKKIEELPEPISEVLRPALERSFSNLVLSVSPNMKDAVMPDLATNPFEGDGDFSIDDDKEVETDIITQDHKIAVEDFPEMILHEAGPTIPDIGLPELLESGIYSKTNSASKKSLGDIVLKLQRELGLRQQNFECADCQLSIGLNFGPSHLCNVTGEYLCELCHTGDTNIVPARVIFNWDHSKYPVGKRAASYLSSSMTEPIYDLKILNPSIYNVVKELSDIRKKRRQLSLLNVYLTTCKEDVKIETRKYLFKSIHTYSLADLISIPGGALKSEIGKILTQAKSHVIGCWLCKQKGFICELCKDPQLIYPFDDALIYRCLKCNAVYHELCINQYKHCPKCLRRKKRIETLNEEELKLTDKDVSS